MTKRQDLEKDVVGGGQEWNEPEADFAPVRLVWVSDLPLMDPETEAKVKAALDKIDAALLMWPAASKAVN